MRDLVLVPVTRSLCRGRYVIPGGEIMGQYLSVPAQDRCVINMGGVGSLVGWWPVLTRE